MTELALPDPQAVTLANVAEIVVQSREARAGCDDINTSLENKRRLEALHSYLSDKTARAALEGEQRMWEVLIGQLLGPAQTGRPEKGSNVEPNPSDDLARVDRNRFRTLAAHASQVAELIASGVTKRAEILKHIDPKPERHYDYCPTCGSRVQAGRATPRGIGV